MVEVKDNGIGIRKEHLHFVFDNFYRVPDRDALARKGFGLGLSYTKKVVDRHKGWCQVESEFGKGSIFSIGLPRLK